MMQYFLMKSALKFHWPIPITFLMPCDNIVPAVCVEVVDLFTPTEREREGVVTHL